MVKQDRQTRLKHLLQLGETLLIKEFFEDAEVVLRKSIKLDSSNAECHYLLGEALCKQGRFPESVSALQRADRLLPQHPRIQHLLGWALYMNGDVTAGRKLLQSALKQLPNDTSILCDLAVLENQQNNEEFAKEYAEKALRIDPENPMAQEVFRVVIMISKLRSKVTRKSN